ncbi:PAS domain S-box protein [Pseudanabaena sp. UWO310]|uniref:PAS domain S-box protein n=1 Tax=Pseudanabaena sp. UWO310 TaxID=2480795 RepID=UPI00115A4514|nr:PAS domain S-box protein [Pseudanabaena sp. UWO310]TYQ27918.1 PAS domain S-box protein [Pseudanabaena sp. UWO310]
MKIPEIPQNESERLVALDRYKILDTLTEQVYDDLTQLAADICGTSIALISLVDEDRQWFKSHIGLDVKQTPRDISFCGHAVSENALLIVPDASKDPRFSDNPLVAQEPYIRFYAGAPLTTPDNYTLGTLCVIDRQPHELTHTQIKQLESLSRLVINQFELRLKEETSRLLASVVESSNDAIITKTSEGIITSWNQSAVNIFGYSQSEAIGKPISMLFPPDRLEEENRILARLKKGERVEHFETVRICKDGSHSDISATISPLFDSNGEIIGFSKIVRDITELKQAQLELAKSNAELVKANQLKDEFLGLMSHELRTPLNAILGMTELLQDEIFGSLNPQQIIALTTIDLSSSHLLKLIDDILDLTNIAAGRLKLNFEVTDINHLCQNSLDLIERSAAKKHLNLELNIQPNLSAIVIDSTRIQQVLLNLLDNAIKFTPEGGSIRLEVSTYVNHLNLSNWLRFTIIDTGIGFELEKFSQLFQPFMQIDSTLSRRYEGLGLGLAIVKQIVELHDGKLEANSILGKGSCFTFELPFENNFGSSRATKQTMDMDMNIQSDIPTRPQVHPLILLAEDNESNILTTVSYLEAKEYRVCVAKNGREAIAFAKEFCPDMILMDIQMPEMDGLKAIELIRLDPSLQNIPIIAMTALAMASDRQKCLEAGANDYVAKPVKFRQLVATIQKMLLNIKP